MGSLRFFVPDLTQFESAWASAAYICGFEGIPWVTHSRVDGDVLEIQRGLDESGRAFCIWPTLTRGPLQVSTASLRCGDALYHLPLELARGVLDSVLQRFADWSRWGVQPPVNFESLLDSAKTHFVQAILDDRDAAVVSAQLSIEFSLAASRLLCQNFSRQLLHNRNRTEGPLQTILSTRLPAVDDWLPAATELRETINFCWVDAGWHHAGAKPERQFERLIAQSDWAVQENLRVLAGPLISMHPSHAQEWFYLVDDFQAIVDEAKAYVTAVVKKLKGRVALFHAFSGLNSLGPFPLSEDQAIHLATEIMSAIRRTDSITPIVFGLDMPDGQYLARSEQAISPLQFADALLQSDIGVNGVVLNCVFGTWPHGTAMVDPIAMSNLIDIYASVLQVPMILNVEGELRTLENPRVDKDLASVAARPAGKGKRKLSPSPSATVTALTDSGDLTPKRISHWQLPSKELPSSETTGLVRQSNCSQMYELLSMAMAKPAVRGVLYNSAIAAAGDDIDARSSALIAPGDTSDLVAGLANCRKRHLSP